MRRTMRPAHFAGVALVAMAVATLTLLAVTDPRAELLQPHRDTVTGAVMHQVLALLVN